MSLHPVEYKSSGDVHSRQIRSFTMVGRKLDTVPRQNTFYLGHRSQCCQLAIMVQVCLLVNGVDVGSGSGGTRLRLLCSVVTPRPVHKLGDGSHATQGRRFSDRWPARETRLKLPPEQRLPLFSANRANAGLTMQICICDEVFTCVVHGFFKQVGLRRSTTDTASVQRSTQAPQGCAIGSGDSAVTERTCS